MPSRQITHNETHLLVKGFNFSITFKTLPNKDKGNIRDKLNNLEKKKADPICDKISLTHQNS